MPFVTLTVTRPTPAQRKDRLLAAAHAGLVAAGVPPTDRFQRVLELDADDFRFDPSYPDLARPRTRDFAILEILLSVGRSVKIKRTIIDTILSQLEGSGVDPEHLMIVFKETAWENWSFGGGRQPHV